MSGTNLSQVKQHIIKPTLGLLPPQYSSLSAVNLLAFTFLKESNGGLYIVQLNNGPAKGPFQMEPFTHDDCWSNFLKYNPVLADVGRMLAHAGKPDADQMPGNWNYACFMARVKYARDSDPLPAADDATGIATYWKRVYNTHLGAGQVDSASVSMALQAIAA